MELASSSSECAAAEPATHSEPPQLSADADATQPHKLAPFTPSGAGVLQLATELLQLTAGDVLVDLGCGDARMLVHAAQASGCRGVGVEYDAELVARANTRLHEHGVEERVTIVHGDALQADLSDATALFLYLVPQGIKLLLPKLEEARRKRVRIVTYVFSIPGWSYDDIRDFKGTKVYLYNSEPHESSVEASVSS